MLIPVRCMNCGKMLADKYDYYLREVQRLSRENNVASQGIYIDGTEVPNTPQKAVLDKLLLTRYCCRKHFLTHIDLINRI
jgi:DNA-directed RNA polymerase I, II, and III subunit RPABC5